MRVISLVCESMMALDLGSATIPGALHYDFDVRPSNLSATALWLMQSEAPVPDMGDCHSASKAKVFEKGNFISNRKKTRIISNFWPSRFDVRFLDPFACTSGSPICREPNSHHWPVLLKFLRDEFYGGNYEWLIYWSLIGHAECADCRIGNENEGIPQNLWKTTAEWFRLINECVIPLLRKETLLLVHPDHGTARLPSKGGSEYRDGFLFAWGNTAGLPPIGRLTWKDIRGLV